MCRHKYEVLKLAIARYPSFGTVWVPHFSLALGEVGISRNQSLLYFLGL